MKKDRPSAEGYIGEALLGGHGPSEEIHDVSIGEGQTVKRAYAMDNLDLIEDIETSLKDHEHFGGGIKNLRHSLTGARVSHAPGTHGGEE